MGIIIDNFLEIADPGLSTSVKLKVKPGEYLCDYATNNHRYTKIRIFNKESLAVKGSESYKLKEQIIVKYGVCGFFSSPRHIYNEQEWMDFVNKYGDQDLIYEENKMFITESGFGRGYYDIFYKVNSDKEIVDIEVVFIDEANDDLWSDDCDFSDSDDDLD